MCALRDIETAIGLAPMRSFSHLIKAEILLSLTNSISALKECDIACELEPNNFMNFEERAQERAWSEDFAGALEDLDVAIALNPDDTWALRYKSLIYERMGDRVAATRLAIAYWMACPSRLADPYEGLVPFVERNTTSVIASVMKF